MATYQVFLHQSVILDSFMFNVLLVDQAVTKTFR